MTTNLHKKGRRWVVAHQRVVNFSSLSIEEAIKKLEEIRLEFVPGTAHFSSSPVPYPNHHPYRDYDLILGERFATRDEVREYTNQSAAKKFKEALERRYRINEAIRVLRDEAPDALRRENITATEVMEETAI